MITDKNKEEIEKIEKGCKKNASSWNYPKKRKYICGEEKTSGGIKLCPLCKKAKQSTIKTSIQWCEDEIEDWKWTSLTANEMRIKDYATKKLKQLQTHLTYLKEQEKDLK